MAESKTKQIQRYVCKSCGYIEDVTVTKIMIAQYMKCKNSDCYSRVVTCMFLLMDFTIYDTSLIKENNNFLINN